MTKDDALNEIERILRDTAAPARKVDRIFRVLVQCGQVKVDGVPSK